MNKHRDDEQGPQSIPAEGRRALGSDESDRVKIVTRPNAVNRRARDFTIEDVFGSIEPVPGTTTDFGQEIEHAMAEETLRLRVQE
jgi:hypothetical protein